MWGEDGGRRADVLVEGGRIAAVGAFAGQVSDAEVIDATGLVVLPGMIDVHVHVDDRIGRFELADTFPSASEIAVTNGITSLAGFVTQQPGETLTGAIRRCIARAERRSHCDVAFHLTPTVWPWPWDEVERLIARGFTTFKLYTTYREAGLFTPYDRLEVVMARLAALGGRLLVHCEDDATLAAASASMSDQRDPIAHPLARPEAAEVEAIRRVIELAARTGCPTHIVHVSTAASAELVAAARTHAPVTCETAPHYLHLTEERLCGEGGHRYLCTPPLRAEATRARLKALAAAGTIDLLATDHCAFTRADKNTFAGDYRTVPNGIAGLGALVALAFELLVRRHGRPFSELVRLLSANPARLLGAYPRKGAVVAGGDADIVVLDPDGPERPVVSTLADAYETYPGATTTLTARWVLSHGRVVARDGRLVATGNPGGRVLSSPA